MIAGRLPLLALVAGCVLFAGIIAMELTSGPPEPIGQVRPPQRTETAAPAEPSRTPATDELVATALGRPIFSPTRRPPEQALGTAVPAEDALAGARLTGIVIGPDRQMAIFAIAGAKPLELSEGQSITGWHIDRITPQGVSISGPTGVKTLIPTIDPLLDTGARTGRAIPPPPPPPPPPAAASQIGNVPPPLPVGDRRRTR